MEIENQVYVQKQLKEENNSCEQTQEIVKQYKQKLERRQKLIERGWKNFVQFQQFIYDAQNYTLQEAIQYQSNKENYNGLQPLKIKPQLERSSVSTTTNQTNEQEFANTSQQQQEIKNEMEEEQEEQKQPGICEETKQEIDEQKVKNEEEEEEEELNNENNLKLEFDQKLENDQSFRWDSLSQVKTRAQQKKVEDIFDINKISQSQKQLQNKNFDKNSMTSENQDSIKSVKSSQKQGKIQNSSLLIKKSIKKSSLLENKSERHTKELKILDEALQNKLQACLTYKLTDGAIDRLVCKYLTTKEYKQLLDQYSSVDIKMWMIGKRTRQINILKSKQCYLSWDIDGELNAQNEKKKEQNKFAQKMINKCSKKLIMPQNEEQEKKELNLLKAALENKKKALDMKGVTNFEINKLALLYFRNKNNSYLKMLEQKQKDPNFEIKAWMKGETYRQQNMVNALSVEN